VYVYIIYNIIIYNIILLTGSTPSTPSVTKCLLHDPMHVLLEGVAKK